MEERQFLYTSNNDPLIRDIRILIDILNPLASSYRLLVGAADEFNGITLAHKSDLEAAIKRADDMGHIIDDIDKKLKPLIKALIKKMDYYDENIINLDAGFRENESSD
ncbi:MAG: hypothetical protein PHF82_00050 [Lutispora sp.]|nr:hypothetical protein [Lutispora sp.]